MAVVDLMSSTPKERSLLQKSISRLLRNRIAIGSGIFILIILLLIITVLKNGINKYFLIEK